MTKILLLDDDHELCELLQDGLQSAGYHVRTAQSASEGLAKLKAEAFDILLVDYQLGSADGIQLLPEIFAQEPDIKAIVITSHATVSVAVQALKSGAFDFIEKPFELEALLHVVKQAEEHSALVRANRLLKEELSQSRGKLVANSPAMQRLMEKLPRIASADAAVLILGESGTGKELVAHALHQLSPRAAKSFVAINCAALSETLVGSDLFGHERGAYTGALTMKKGRIELADGGTAFLDEIGDMPIATQGHLLRFLEDKKFERLGGTKAIEVDVRILAATNQNLQAQIAEKKFREDLFYRLNVVTLVVPPLRERKEDIAELTQHFLETSAARLNRPAPRLDKEALQLLQNHAFPGNVRELRHLAESVVIHATTTAQSPIRELGTEDLSALMSSGNGHPPATIPSPATQLAAALGNFKRDHIQRVLAENNGNKTRAARQLGISRVHLMKLVKEFGAVEK